MEPMLLPGAFFTGRQRGCLPGSRLFFSGSHTCRGVGPGTTRGRGRGGFGGDWTPGRCTHLHPSPRELSSWAGHARRDEAGTSEGDQERSSYVGETLLRRAAAAHKSTVLLAGAGIACTYACVFSFWVELDSVGGTWDTQCGCVCVSLLMCGM